MPWRFSHIYVKCLKKSYAFRKKERTWFICQVYTTYLIAKGPSSSSAGKGLAGMQCALPRDARSSPRVLANLFLHPSLPAASQPSLSSPRGVPSYADNISLPLTNLLLLPINSTTSATHQDTQEWLLLRWKGITILREATWTLGRAGRQLTVPGSLRPSLTPIYL